MYYLHAEPERLINTTNHNSKGPGSRVTSPKVLTLIKIHFSLGEAKLPTLGREKMHNN